MDTNNETPVSTGFQPQNESSTLPKIEGVGSLISFASNTFTRNWKTLGMIAVVPLILNSIMQILLVTGMSWGILVAILLGITSAVLSFMSVIALVMSIHILYSDPNAVITVQESYKKSLKYFWPMVLVSIIAAVAQIGGFILLIIPGVIFIVYTAFYVFTLVLDDKRGLSAFTESYGLVKGRWWAVFGRMIVMALVALAISLGIGFLYGLISSIFGGAMTQSIQTISSGSDWVWLIIGLIVNIIIGSAITIFSLSYIYRMFVSLKEKRVAVVDTSKFKKWVIGFLVIGPIAIVIITATLITVVALSVSTAMGKADEARNNSIEMQNEIMQLLEQSNGSVSGTNDIGGTAEIQTAN